MSREQDVPSEQERSVVWPLVLAVLVWGGFIAATSSTVVLPHDFFAWFAAHVFQDETSFRRFAVFWGFSWFAIVKGWHAAEFAILFLIMYAFLDRFTQGGRLRNLIAASALCIVFAISDEYHQTFVPGRGGTWVDVAIDSLGVVLAASIVRLRVGRQSG